MSEVKSAKHAVELTKALWTWMYERGHFSAAQKAGWPGWDKLGFICKNHCPCCDYAAMDCDICPLLSVWGDSDETHVACEREGSPFLPFSCDRGTPEDAAAIVQGCARVLAELEPAIESLDELDIVVLMRLKLKQYWDWDYKAKASVNKLVERAYVQTTNGSKYRVTDKGDVFIAALLSTPEPVCGWEMP